MLAAFATSSLFLVCYLVYHAQVGSVPFTRQGLVRPLYFTILITHVIPRGGRRCRWPSSRCRAALARTVRTAPGDRPLDAADLAVRLGDRRAGLRAAVSPDLALLSRMPSRFGSLDHLRGSVQHTC